jgi:hypothetical protein
MSDAEIKANRIIQILENYSNLLEEKLNNKNGQAVAGDQRPDKLTDKAGGASSNEY